MKRRAIAALALLLGACSETFAVPEVAQALPDVAVAKPALTMIGSWAYLWSPAVRAVLTARTSVGGEPTVVEADVVTPEQAALVGVYASGDRTLILDAVGGYVIEDRSAGSATPTPEIGRWSLQGIELVLRGEGTSKPVKRLGISASADTLHYREQLFVPKEAVAEQVDATDGGEEGEGR